MTEVTHDERGNIEVVIGEQRHLEGGDDLYEADEDLQDDIKDLTESGWTVRSEAPNKLYRNPPANP